MRNSGGALVVARRIGQICKESKTRDEAENRVLIEFPYLTMDVLREMSNYRSIEKLQK